VKLMPETVGDNRLEVVFINDTRWEIRRVCAGEPAYVLEADLKQAVHTTLRKGADVLRDHKRLYLLDADGSPAHALDNQSWGDWLRTANRVVSRTTIDAGTTVLTTFTGVNNSWTPIEKPILWETRIFGGPHDDLGQRDATITDASDSHVRWCRVARGELALERACKLCPRSSCVIDREDSLYCQASDEDGVLWLSAHEVHELFGIDRKSLSNYEHLGKLRPRQVKCLDYYKTCEKRRRTFDDQARVHCAVTMYGALEIIGLSKYDAGIRHGNLYLPQHLKSAHASILDAYVSPGIITLLEFRVRYGYRCKQFRKRYRVTRADGTAVCSELGAGQAWKVAHQLEQGRLAPILIARDAIAEGRLAHATQIADQLTPDLAEPLRREIALAETGAVKIAKVVGGAGTVAAQR
jgi:hypothetical protein